MFTLDLYLFFFVCIGVMVGLFNGGFLSSMLLLLHFFVVFLNYHHFYFVLCDIFVSSMCINH